MKIPNHIAIILDGNGRWAKAKGLPRNAGHKAGAKNVEEISRYAGQIGVKYLTFYAFSTENWSRPEAEVSALMKLLESYLKNCVKNAEKDNLIVRVIGDISRLEPSLQKQILEVEEASKNHTGVTLTIALNYGSRDEIIRGIHRMLPDLKSGKIKEEDINPEVFSNYLDTAGIPDPDLLIRTSGEQRLSNYLLWQLAYTEFYFTKVPWPDFSKEDLDLAIEAYNKRERRFGGLTDTKEEANV